MAWQRQMTSLPPWGLVEWAWCDRCRAPAGASWRSWPHLAPIDLWVFGCVWKCCVPLNPMVLLIIIPIKWLFHCEYTLFSDKPIWHWDGNRSLTIKWPWNDHEMTTANQCGNICLRWESVLDQIWSWKKPICFGQKKITCEVNLATACGRPFHLSLWDAFQAILEASVDEFSLAEGDVTISADGKIMAAFLLAFYDHEQAFGKYWKILCKGIQ